MCSAQRELGYSGQSHVHVSSTNRQTAGGRGLLSGAFLVTCCITLWYPAPVSLSNHGSRGGTLSTDDEAQWAARVAFMVLGSQVPEQSSSKYVVLPSNDLLVAAEAVEALARLAKPVECHAAILGGRTIIDCSPIVAPGGMKTLAEQGRRIEAYWSERLLGQGIVDNATVDVLLESRGDSLVVPLAGLLRWAREYLCIFTFGYSTAPPPPGVLGVIRISSPAHLRVEREPN